MFEFVYFDVEVRIRNMLQALLSFIGDLYVPEIMSQRILVGIILVGRLGVPIRPVRICSQTPERAESNS